MSKFGKNNKRGWEENPNKKKEKTGYGREEFDTLEDRDSERAGFPKEQERKNKYDRGLGKKRKSA